MASSTRPTATRGLLYGAAGALVGVAVSALAWRRHLQESTAAARNALHDIDLELTRRGVAPRPGKLTRTRAAAAFDGADGGDSWSAGAAAHVVRIVLTGGPCAGKSSALDYLRREATQRGFDVLTAPEIATVVLNSGYKFPDSQDPKFVESAFGFQLAIARLQLSTERNLLRLAEITGRPTIVVFDRGVLDGKTYVTAEEWQRILDRLRDSQGRPVDNEYLLRRYDGVVHLVTAADGAATFYKSGHTVDDQGHAVVRRETAAQARALDEKLRGCFAGHPHHVVVGNVGGFEKKLRDTARAVMDIALAVHPQEAE